MYIYLGMYTRLYTLYKHAHTCKYNYLEIVTYLYTLSGSLKACYDNDYRVGVL